MRRFGAFIIFVLLTALAIFRDFEATQQWLPEGPFWGLSALDYLYRFDLVITVLAGALYVSFVVAPLMRWKLTVLSETWYGGLLAVLSMAVLFIGLGVVLLTSLVITDMTVVSRIIESGQTAPFLEANMQSVDRFFGFTKLDMLRLAKIFILSVVSTVLYIPANIGLVIICREQIEPWLLSLGRHDREVSKKMARILTTAMWSVGILVFFWQVDLFHVYGDGEHWRGKTIPDLPTSGTQELFFGLQKYEFLTLAELFIFPAIVAFLLWATISTLSSVMKFSAAFAGRWPQDVEVSKKRVLLLSSVVIVLATLPVAMAARLVVMNLIG